MTEATDKQSSQNLSTAIRHFEVGEYRLAIPILLDILRKDSDLSAAQVYLGLTHQALGEHTAALKHLLTAATRGHQTVAVYVALANSMHALGQYEQSQQFYKQALKLDPASSLAAYNFALYLQERGLLAQAIEYYLIAIRHNPAWIEAYCNLGLVYFEESRLSDAIEVLDQAIKKYPKHILAHYNLAIALLAAGEYYRGWEEYEWRIKHPDRRVRQLPFRTWRGEPLTGKNLLVYAEQGIGDEVMFSSRRWKSDIRNIDDPLSKVSLMRGVYYTWDQEHGGKHDVGFIAEEVGEVLPEIVQHEENGVDAIGLDYAKVTPLLVEAINALLDRQEVLEARISELEGQTP